MSTIIWAHIFTSNSLRDVTAKYIFEYLSWNPMGTWNEKEIGASTERKSAQWSRCLQVYKLLY